LKKRIGKLEKEIKSLSENFSKSKLDVKRLEKELAEAELEKQTQENKELIRQLNLILKK
jgi:hypothetical protein